MHISHRRKMPSAVRESMSVPLAFAPGLLILDARFVGADVLTCSQDVHRCSHLCAMVVSVGYVRQSSQTSYLNWWHGLRRWSFERKAMWSDPGLRSEGAVDAPGAMTRPCPQSSLEASQNGCERGVRAQSRWVARECQGRLGWHWQAIAAARKLAGWIDVRG